MSMKVIQPKLTRQNVIIKAPLYYGIHQAPTPNIRRTKKRIPPLISNPSIPKGASAAKNMGILVETRQRTLRAQVVLFMVFGA